MELNKETAFRLWAAQFGKTEKAVDFAGRKIVKSAYNNRNSKFGWNVDQIYPQSRGGKTVDYNLICCHIKTNDEKADKFPCFVSNKIHFKIQKCQKHYEIIPKESSRGATQNKKDFNFFDAAQGMELWESCLEESQDVFVGYVKIRLTSWNVRTSFFVQFCNFLKELFATSLVFVTAPRCGINGWYNFHYSSCCELAVIIPDLPTIQDIEELLDNCIVLNTYATFFRKKYQVKIEICCGMKCCHSFSHMSDQLISDIVNNQLRFGQDLAIDRLILRNTSAQKKISENPYQNFYPYDIIFTKLNEDLQKYL